MNLSYGLLNFGLDFELDIETQEETKANGSERLYELKVAKRFVHNISNFYFSSNDWFIILAICIFVFNFKNVFCDNYYLKMVLFDTQHIFDKEALIKQKALDRPKVFNLVVAKRTEFALIGIFVLQFVNLILLWLYPLSTVVTLLLNYLNNTDYNGHPGRSDSGGPLKY